jgi:electron transfer flavoprotein alpha subunit
VEETLILVHTEPNGTLSPVALSTIWSYGRDAAIGLVGGSIEAAAAQLAGCPASRFLAVEGQAFTESRYSTDAVATEALCRASEATLVLAPSTSRWARALPGVACRLGGRVDTHVSAVNEGPTATRWFYRQRMEAVLTRTARPWFLLLDTSPQPAATPSGPPPVFEKLALEVPTPRTTVKGIVSPPADAQTIRPDAKLLFVAGAGWTKKQADGAPHAPEAESLILDFLRLAKASLGGSKSLVDLSGEGQAVLSCMTHLNQIGQTGSTPRHAKGLSTCCHGEEPHTVGWRFITERRAVNLDANCGWSRGKADVLYVADAFEVMRELNRLLAT